MNLTCVGDGHFTSIVTSQPTLRFAPERSCLHMASFMGKWGEVDGSSTSSISTTDST